MCQGHEMTRISCKTYDITVSQCVVIKNTTNRQFTSYIGPAG